jgi:hypothetical protein
MNDCEAFHYEFSPFSFYLPPHMSKYSPRTAFPNALSLSVVWKGLHETTGRSIFIVVCI